MYPRIVFENSSWRVVRRAPTTLDSEIYDIEYVTEDAMHQPSYHHRYTMSEARIERERHGNDWQDALIVDLLRVVQELEASSVCDVYTALTRVKRDKQI